MQTLKGTINLGHLNMIMLDPKWMVRPSSPWSSLLSGDAWSWYRLDKYSTELATIRLIPKPKQPIWNGLNKWIRECELITTRLTFAYCYFQTNNKPPSFSNNDHSTKMNDQVRAHFAWRRVEYFYSWDSALAGYRFPNDVLPSIQSWMIHCTIDTWWFRLLQEVFLAKTRVNTCPLLFPLNQQLKWEMFDVTKMWIEKDEHTFDSWKLKKSEYFSVYITNFLVSFLGRIFIFVECVQI